jgi:hypothetical protein
MCEPWHLTGLLQGQLYIFYFFFLHLSCLLAVYFLLLQIKIRLIIFIIIIVGNVVYVCLLFFIMYSPVPIFFSVSPEFFWLFNSCSYLINVWLLLWFLFQWIFLCSVHIYFYVYIFRNRSDENRWRRERLGRGTKKLIKLAQRQL